MSNIYSSKPLNLTSGNAAWNPDEVIEQCLTKPLYVEDDKLRHLIFELDRRFMHLWDKTYPVGSEEREQAVSLIDRLKNEEPKHRRVKREGELPPTPVLERGDIIELGEDHKVYAKVPEHFLYENRRGVWDLTESDIYLRGHFAHMQGKYIVTSTASKGGGQGHGRHDVYPDGHNVECVSECGKYEVSFYQTGAFTAMITHITPIGKAKVKLVIEQD